jgi:hypothetical protein
MLTPGEAREALLDVKRRFDRLATGKAVRLDVFTYPGQHSLLPPPQGDASTWKWWGESSFRDDLDVHIQLRGGVLAVNRFVSVAEQAGRQALLWAPGSPDIAWNPWATAPYWLEGLAEYCVKGWAPTHPAQRELWTMDGRRLVRLPHEIEALQARAGGARDLRSKPQEFWVEQIERHHLVTVEHAAATSVAFCRTLLRQQQQSAPQHGSRNGPRGAGSERKHSTDFRSVRWGDETFAFTPAQARVVKHLWGALEDGAPEVSHAALQEEAEVLSPIRNIFKGHPAWRKLIVPGRSKGTLRLAEFSESRQK